MTQKIKQLESVARQLEPSQSERHHLLTNVTAYAESFIQNLGEAPAFVTGTDNGLSLLDSPIEENGISIEAALTLLKENVDCPNLSPGSPRMFGYIPGGPLYPSALGDYLAAISNRFAGIFYASPGAVRMENMLLRWTADLMGYPETAAGNLTSGGSIAHLIAIVTAREAMRVKPANIERTVVYTTHFVHHAVTKALKIAGLETAVQHTIPVDDQYRLDANALEQAILADKQAGLIPWLVIASAGTTHTGAVDPLAQIGRLTKAHDIWFHVDGAYGAAFMLCEEGRSRLAGIELSDSMIIDPHKGFFMPWGTGIVLVKDRRHLYEAHHDSASYMQDALDLIEELSPADLSPELSKHFRGVRMWLHLKLFGVAPFRAALAEKIELARYFYEKLKELDGFEVGPYPDLSVVTYRYLPKQGDVDDFNRQLLEAILEDGRIFISSTQLDGNFVLRLVVLNFQTHLEEVDLALEILQEQAQKLCSESSVA
ncbi:MAG: aminotransferase class V-fold PLP-dependent enzyme [Chloroflexota bacterium]